MLARGIEASSPLGIVIIAGACLLVGWALYRLIETPFMKLRAHYFPTSFPKTRDPCKEFACIRWLKKEAAQHRSV